MKPPRNWGQLLTCELAGKAKEHMMQNPSLTFHNWEHIERVAWHAQYTFEFPFDVAFGKAIVAHDVVYDNKPQKEWRSAEWLFAADGETTTNITAARHIMKTDGHQITDDNRMILVDLGNFMYPRMTHEDFYKVMMESMNLYKAKPAVIIDASLAFLTKLHDNFSDDVLNNVTPMERMAFLGIRTGIERAMMSYEESSKGAQRG